MPSATIYLPASSEFYNAALEGLTLLNVAMLEQCPEIPPIYESGVRYRRELTERWKNAGLTFKEGHGDCEDFACWRAAELRLTGEDPGAFTWTYQTGPRRLHAVVRRSDGRIEDPSVVLGMQPVHPAARIIDDPTPGDTGISFDVCGDGSRACMRIPMHFGRALVVDSGDDDVSGAWYDPVGRALRTAVNVLKTPEAQAILPPEARIALMAAQRYGSAANLVKREWEKTARKPTPKPPQAAPVFQTGPSWEDDYEPNDDDYDVEGAPFGFGAIRRGGTQQQQQGGARTPPPPARGTPTGSYQQQQPYPPEYGPPPGYPPGYPPPGQSFNPAAMPPGYPPGYPPPYYQQPQGYNPGPQFDVYNLPTYGGFGSDPSAPPGGWNDADMAMMNQDW